MKATFGIVGLMCSFRFVMLEDDGASKGVKRTVAGWVS